MTAPVHISVVGSYAESLVSFRGPLLRTLVERGHRVTGCAPQADRATLKALAAMGVDYRCVPLDRAGMRLDRDVRALWTLIGLFREVRPDIVLAYTIKPVIYGLLAARLAGVPRRYAMITGLGYAFIGAGRRARLAGAAARRLYKMSLRSAERILFQNPDDLALFEHLGLVRRPEQASIINGSGVDLDFFRPAPLPVGETSFLLIARLIEDKGIYEYVSAAQQVRSRHPAARFHLVGWFDKGNPAGCDEQQLRAWLDDGVVEYHGELEDVRPVIAATSVYVLPSYREGTPRTVLEAMAMGRPVITTDVPGCRETVRDGVNGYLVPAKDADALARAMLRFIKEPGLIPAMGRESRRIAEDKYDVRKVNQAILEAMRLA